MDGIPFEISLFLVATFAGAFVAGLSGFAFGLVAASLWLYILTPLQSATLIVPAFMEYRRALESAGAAIKVTALGPEDHFRLPIVQPVSSRALSSGRCRLSKTTTVSGKR